MVAKNVFMDHESFQKEIVRLISDSDLIVKRSCTQRYRENALEWRYSILYMYIRFQLFFYTYNFKVRK